MTIHSMSSDEFDGNHICRKTKVDLMKVLVAGGGGREHALCWTIAGSPLVDKILRAPVMPASLRTQNA